MVQLGRTVLAARLIGAAMMVAGLLSSCSTGGDEPPPPPPKILSGRPKGVPIHRRVYRRPGRLGPQGGLLGYQQKFEYPQIPIVHHPEVDQFVERYTNSQRSYISEALARRARYLPQIEATLARFKLPLELANLAFIESRFVPNIRSKDGSTVGLWQLSAATARNYGLVVSKKVDERTDVVKSTEAAARFLASLFDSFGDWYLAAAAWNTGPVRVQKALDDATAEESLDALDVFELTAKGVVCETTRQFVAKLGALVIVTKDLERYGFDASAAARTPELPKREPSRAGKQIPRSAAVTKKRGKGK